MISIDFVVEDLNDQMDNFPVENLVVSSADTLMNDSYKCW